MVSPDGLTTVTRRHLAAIDLTTGDLLPWAPTTNGSVEAMVTDGTTLFLGGSFTTVNGVARPRLAAVDTAGTLVPWVSGASGTVLALHLRGTVVYVGGAFTTLGGQPRDRLGAVSTTGELLDWTAPANERVKAITTTAIGDVAVAGYFDMLNGLDVDHIARLDAVTGETLSWGSGSSQEVVGLVTGPDDNLYAAIAGSGGKIRSWTSDGHHRWTTYADGDVNAITFHDGQVIAGGHWIYLNDGATYLPRLAAFDPATGLVDLDLDAQAEQADLVLRDRRHQPRRRRVCSRRSAGRRTGASPCTAPRSSNEDAAAFRSRAGGRGRSLRDGRAQTRRPRSGRRAGSRPRSPVGTRRRARWSRSRPPRGPRREVRRS